MAEFHNLYNIVLVDCCEHTFEALKRVPHARVVSLTSGNATQTLNELSGFQLIVIGATPQPLKRSFISQLQDMNRSVPSLILRRDSGVDEGSIRGHFVLSDRGSSRDFAIVQTIREMLPLPACKHSRKNLHNDLLQNIVSLLEQIYPDPELDLDQVASQLAISSRKLSNILNREVGVSFPQLLRSIRIKEAKRMLSARHYSVKQVAMRVGFTNSHYFSRSFKEFTGLSASEFRSFHSQAERAVPALRPSFVPEVQLKRGIL